MAGKSICVDLRAWLIISLVQILNAKADCVPSASIVCGDTIDGATSEDMPICYTFINDLTNANETGVYVQFSTCGSEFDTKLILYDSDWTQIADCDQWPEDSWGNSDEDCVSCDNYEYHTEHAKLITHSQLNDTIYFLEVTSTRNQYGAFQLQIDCDNDLYSLTSSPSNYTSTSCTIKNNQYICEYTSPLCTGPGYDAYGSLWPCYSLHIRCLDAMDCHVRCIGEYACKGAVIDWPINGIGSIECDGAYACNGITFPQPPPNDNSVIECGQEAECSHASISCPQSAHCHLKCIADQACKDATVDWPINGTGSVECDGAFACYRLDRIPQVGPSPNENNTIECGHDSICEKASIVCPKTEDCHLKCTATDACSFAKVVWPIDGIGSIECNGERACENLNFPQPPPNDSYTIECDHAGECAEASIFCPQSADCHLKCIADYACDSATVVWPIHGVGSIECNGHQACASIDFPRPKPNESFEFECSDIQACHSSRIICPQNADCHLKCGGASACYNATIERSMNGTTTIQCNGDRACNRLKPLSNASSISNANYMIKCNDCFRSILNCPAHADCTVVCNSSSSCHLTTINWSSEFVKSELICLHPSACDSATQPPKQYEYHFDTAYNVSHKGTETLHITEEFHIAFVMKIDSFTQGSNYSLISIENENMTVFKLRLHTDCDPPLFEIEFDNEDVVFFVGSEQNISDQLAMDHGFIITKSPEHYTFAMDEIYFNQLTADHVNPLASRYSMDGRDNIFSMHLGANNKNIEARIYNVTVEMDLYQYYQIENVAESYVCFEQVRESYAGVRVNFSMEYKYDFYGYFDSNYEPVFRSDLYGTNSTTSTGSLMNVYLPIVAYFNETLFMFDGHHSDYLYYSTFDNDDSFNFDWIPWTMAYYGELALFSQSWTQIHDKLYFIGADEEQFGPTEVWWELTKVIVELDLTTKDYIYLDMWGCCGVSGWRTGKDIDSSDVWKFEKLAGYTNLYHSSETASLCDNVTHLYHIYKANEQTIHIYNIATSNWTHSDEYVVVSDSTNCQIYEPSQTMYLFGGRIRNGTDYAYSDRIYKYDILEDTAHSVQDRMHAPTINIKSLQKGIYIYLFSGSSFNDVTVPVQIFNIFSETLFVAPDTFSVNIDSYYNDKQNQIWVFDSNSMFYYHDDIVLFDFSSSSNQTTVPGDSAAIFVDIFACSSGAVEDTKSNTYSFSFTSENAAVGIQSTVIIENGACTEICDAYSICGDCETGLNPIISANADVQSISVLIEPRDNSDNVKLTTDTISIFVSECPIGQGIEPDALVIDCNECSINTFKITAGNLPCYSCPINADGFHCDGSSDIHIQYNYWFIAFNSSNSQFISPFHANHIDIYSIHAVQCPPNYCCQSAPHCSYLDSFILSDGDIHKYNPHSAGVCAMNRNSSTPLCARCVQGTYELFGSVRCGECRDRIHLFWLLPIAFVTALFVVFLLFRSKPEDLSIYTADEVDLKQLIRKDEIQAVSILILKIMIYYYQTLSQILGAKSVSHFLLPLLTIFNFSFESNSSSASGFCVFPSVSSPLIKLVLSSLTPIVFIGFNLVLIVFAWTTYHNRNDHSNLASSSSRNRMIIIVLLKVITITAGTLLSLGFKLLSCVTLPGTNAFVHYYDSTAGCTDSYWFIGLFMVIAVSLLFIRIFVQLRKKSAKWRKNPNHIYYQFTKPFTKSCWYFEFVLFIRRLIIAALTSFRISNSNDLDILLQTTLAIFLSIECFMKPFKFDRLNVMEAISLLSLIAVTSAISRNGDSNRETFIQLFVAFAILIPFCICIFNIAKAIKWFFCEASVEQMEDKKMKLVERAPTTMRNVFMVNSSGDANVDVQANAVKDQIELNVHQTNVLDEENTTIEMPCKSHVQQPSVLDGYRSTDIDDSGTSSSEELHVSDDYEDDGEEQSPKTSENTVRKVDEIQ